MSKTRSNLVISHMDQEERRHWASWIGTVSYTHLTLPTNSLV